MQKLELSPALQRRIKQERLRKGNNPTRSTGTAKGEKIKTGQSKNSDGATKVAEQNFPKPSMIQESSLCPDITWASMMAETPAKMSRPSTASVSQYDGDNQYDG